MSTDQRDDKPSNREVSTPREQPAPRERHSVDGAPGIPAGSKGVEEALTTGDSELGGVIASDTTPGGRTGDEPSPKQVHEEDRKRNTL